MKFDRNIISLIVTLTAFLALIFAGVANLSSIQKRCDEFIAYTDSCISACADGDTEKALEVLEDFREYWDSQGLYLAAIFEHSNFERIEVSMSLARAALLYDNAPLAYSHFVSVREMLLQLKHVEVFKLENIL